MKTSFAVKTLSQTLTLAARGAMRKSSLPILGNAILRQTAGNFEIVTTDLDNFLSVSIPSTGDAGETTAPIHRLKDTIKLCKNEVEIESSAQKLAVRNGSIFSIDTLPVSEFPQIPPFTKHKTCIAKIADFRRALSLVSYAQSTDASRYVLQGVYFEISARELRLVATDGRRCALADIAATSKLDDGAKNAAGWILPTSAVSLLEIALPKAPKKSADEIGEIIIQWSEETGKEVAHSRFTFNSTACQHYDHRQAETAAGTPVLNPSKPSGGIVDFGEKISGARKDVWGTYSATMREALPADYAQITLSKHFPEPDYEAAIARGASVDNLAMMKALRDMIPAKPRRSYKLERWGALVTMAHGIVQKMVAGDFKLSAARIDELIAQAGGEIAKKITLYRLLGYPLFTVADGWKIESGCFSCFNGDKYENQKLVTYAAKDGRMMPELNSENPDHLAAFGEVFNLLKTRLQSELGTPAGPREIKFSIYSERRTGEFFIGKKGARGVVRIKTGFKMVKEARAFLVDSRAELEKTWEEMSKAPQLRKAANLPRIGPDRRAGNVSPEMFSEAFGFRGVQFGNYVESDRRQADLNEAHDALIDMAMALNIPARALSLDGSLGMAFGARGIGGFKAHYEPGQVVINITKTHGPGSLAHEWFHALDNYLARLDETGATNTRSGRFITSDVSAAKNIRPEVVAAFKEIRRVLSVGSFAARSDELDATRSKPYYGTTIEKAARAFEIYISDKLNAQGIFNDYMANIYKGAEAGMEWDKSAYPFEREMDNDGIRAAFAQAMATLHTTEGGLIN